MNQYLLAGLVALAIGTLGVMVARRYKTPEADHVSQSALDRIRTEYR